MDYTAQDNFLDIYSRTNFADNTRAEQASLFGSHFKRHLPNTPLPYDGAVVGRKGRSITRTYSTLVHSILYN